MQRKKITLAVAIVLLLVGCTGSGALKDRVGTSLEGVLLEELVPEDAWLFVSLSTREREAAAYGRALWQRMLGEDQDALLSWLVGSAMGQKNLSFDVRPFTQLATDGTRFGLASVEEVFENDEIGRVLYVLFEAKNFDQAEQFAHNLQGLVPDVATHKDVVIVTSAPGFAKRAAEQPVRRSFARNPAYHELLEKVEATEFLYGIVTRAPLSITAQLPSATTRNGAEIPLLAKATQGSAFSLFPSAEGIQFDGYGIFARDQVANSPLAGITDMKPLSFFKSLTVDEPILLIEGANLALGMGEFLDTPIGQTFAPLKTLLPLFQGNSALLLQDVGGVLPSLEIFVEASQAPQQRDAFLLLLDRIALTLKNYLHQRFQAGIDFSESVPIEADGVTGTQLGFFFDRLPEEVQLKYKILGLFGNTATISYGKRIDDTVFVSLVPSASESSADIKRPLQDDPLYSRLATHLEDYDEANAMYIRGASAVVQLDRLFQFFADSATLSAEEYRTYQRVRRVLAPIQGFLHVSRRNAKAGELYTRAFLLVE